MPENIDKFFSELELFGIKLGLEQTQELFERIGSPHEKLRFIHLAGTNGKGSVGAMLSAGLSGAGYKTGFYSSPHLMDIRERFRIDGKAIPESRLSDVIGVINPHICEMRRNGSSPTYFEVTTAIAAAYFAEENVDFVIWETGMGGRFDATNIVMPELSVITSIGMDHCSHLGSTIAEIAYEKAGIIKEGIPLFCGELDSEAEKVILAKAAKENSEYYLSDDGEEITIPDFPLLGSHQKKNAKLATNILKYLSEKNDFDLDKSLRGIRSISWPGRLQILKDGTVIDGAHNPQAVESLVASLQTLFPGRKYKIIFASLKDKDTINVLKILATISEEFIFPRIKSSRGIVSPEDLIAIIEELSGVQGKSKDSFSEALKSSDTGFLLITGSLYLVGEALKELADPKEVLDIY